MQLHMKERHSKNEDEDEGIRTKEQTLENYEDGKKDGIQKVDVNGNKRDNEQLVSPGNEELFWKKIFEESGVRRKQSPKSPASQSFKKRLTMLAAIALIAGAVFQAAYRFYLDFNYGFEAVDLKNTEKIKEIMFSGQPWIILCRWPGENKKWSAAPTLDSARRDLVRIVKLGKIDCTGTLSSGVTFQQRFQIPQNTVAILMANGKAPRILTAWALSSRENLITYVQRLIKIDIRIPSDPAQFVRLCLQPKGARCVAFLKKDGLAPEIRLKDLPIMLSKNTSTRKLKTVIIDTNKFDLLLGDNFPVPQKSKAIFYKTNVVCIINKSSLMEKDIGRRSIKKTTDMFYATYYSGEFTKANSLMKFFKKCAEADESSDYFKKTEKVPSLKRKPSATSTTSAK